MTKLSTVIIGSIIVIVFAYILVVSKIPFWHSATNVSPYTIMYRDFMINKTPTGVGVREERDHLWYLVKKIVVTNPRYLDNAVTEAEVWIDSLISTRR
jgi:hypothetical protein